MLMTIAPITDIRRIWNDFMRGTLDEIAEPYDYIPEDVYAELQAGRSILCAWWDACGMLAGYIIVTPTMSYGIKTLHIWVAHNLTNEEFGCHHFDEIADFAREEGFQRITASSTLRGAARYYAKMGFMPIESLYKLEI